MGPIDKPLPTLQNIHRDEADKIIQAIIEDGACIIKSFASVGAVERVNADTHPYLEVDKPWKGDLFPPETRRCTRLIARSATAREWLVDPLVTKLLSIFVDKTTHNYYGETRHTYTSNAILNTGLTMRIGPGGKAQRLHRDDKNFHMEHPDQTKTGYKIGTDVELSFLVPGIATTPENGATLVIPGSHLWDSERIPKVEEAGYGIMDVGDCFVMLGGFYHAGGHNLTKDQYRPVHDLSFIRGYLRQEENAYLSFTKEEVLSWPFEVKMRMGYTVSSPNLGFVDFIQPYKYLAGDYDPNQPGDLDSSQELNKAA
ncbi:phytanoyl-CoA dioxygenase family protein [Mollisia scopiformis]|uniref:Phytanoyl-CoA dioxygenase family protein n=1 Tax=Mollisia scopiformis TaxID=149040 RepID=A0A194XFP4_MOLSC|nr:phytanoyl-CoA dioxygenase family protein [Mollisia scopiformis]KUJ18988.1 phytanoyl-CoA dioxygenase family protein [Mollisia scopiformis]